MADVLRLGRGHVLELGFGRRVGDHPVQHVELRAQPPHLARRLRDRLDRRIVLGQAHEFVRGEVAARHGVGKLLLLRLDRRDPFRRNVGHAEVGSGQVKSFKAVPACVPPDNRVLTCSPSTSSVRISLAPRLTARSRRFRGEPVA